MSEGLVGSNYRSIPPPDADVVLQPKRFRWGLIDDVGQEIGDIKLHPNAGGGTRFKNRRWIDDRHKIKDNVVVAMYDARVIRTWEDLQSERRKRQGMTDEPAYSEGISYVWVDGTLEVDPGHNLVVDDGLNLIPNLFLGVAGFNPVSHCGVGSSTTAVSNTQHDLVAVIEKIAVTTKFTTVNVAHADTFFDTTQGNGSVNESGLFNSVSAYVSAPVMFCRRVLTTQRDKDSTKTMTASWALTLTAI